jgi:hypothetical protein
LPGEERNRWERCSSCGVANSNWERTRAVGMPSSDGYEAFVPAVLGNRASLFMATVAVMGNTELDNSHLVRSSRHEYGCGRRRQSDVTTSCSRDTNADEVQRSKELIVMGRRTRKLSVQHSTLAIATKRSLAKASIDPGFTTFLDPEDLEVMGMDQERMRDGRLLHKDFSRTLTTHESFYFYCFHLASRKELMLQGRRDWQQGIKSTGITKRPLRRKGRLTKEFHNSLYER